MKEKMWAYLMHLSDNMWGDPGAPMKTSTYQPKLTVDDDVWKQTIDYLPSQGFNTVVIDIGDAIQYERHPEIAIEGAWSKERLKKELNRMRAMGLEPIPKLNFSAGHDAWLGVYSRMVSTPQYYQVCEDVILEVAELFDTPKYFHLGMDEEVAIHQSGLAMCVVRNGDLWWHDIYHLFNACEKAGVRPWVWSDYCWHHPETFLEKMPKSVLQSNWWYNKIRKNDDGCYREVQYDTYRILEAAGYDQVPTCSTCEGYNLSALETMQLGKEEIAPKHLFGYMTAPWQNPRANTQFQLMNDALQFGVAKRTIY